MTMKRPAIVSRSEWLDARLAHLEAEKALTRQRDALSRARRELPWVEVTKDYRFDGPDGTLSLGELFLGHRQLIVYHFMFGPDWEAGCPSCSFWIDNFDGIDVHLAHRDTGLVLVSRAAFETIEAYRRRMGWRLRWVSSLASDFNRDFDVTFTAEELEHGDAYYNYRRGTFPSEEAPGVSVFARDDDGRVYHTYSCFARGLDMLNGAYQLLDLTPAGRDEDGLDFTMAWLRRHDEYET